MKHGSAAALLLMTLTLAACQIPVYRPTTTPEPQPGKPVEPAHTPPPAESIPPVVTPPPEEQLPPAPPPTTRSYTLKPASRSLVNQAQTQLKSKDFGGAATNLERALRIEPSNPLLWIEYGKLRFIEANYAQADNMGRKAVTLASGDPRTQAIAWRLIADSLQARNKTTEAREANARADALLGRN